MTRILRTAAMVVLGATTLAPTQGLVRAQAGSAQKPQLLLINEISLKPDAAPDWPDLQKEFLAAQKKSGLAWRDAWANGPGGDPYARAIVTPIASLAQFDEPNPMVKAVGEEAYQGYVARNRKIVAGSRTTIVTTRPDLGFGTRPAVYKLALLSVVNTASGRGPEFEALLKNDVVPALKKAGVSYYSVSQVVFGDDVSKYLTLTPVNDFAELAKGSPLERGLGPEGMTKLMQKAGPLVTRLERRIIRYLPELSYGPPAPTSN